MITYDDYRNAWGRKKHKVYDIDVDAWTKELFYIFVRNDYAFFGRKPDAKDFIQKVKIKIIWVYAKKGSPYVINCKNSSFSYGITREQSEVFLSSEEIENSDDMKIYLWWFLKNYKEICLKENKRLQENQKQIKDTINENIEKIDLIDELI